MKPDELPLRNQEAVPELCPHCNGELGRVSHFKGDEEEFYCSGCGLLMRRQAPEKVTPGPGVPSSAS